MSSLVTLFRPQVLACSLLLLTAAASTARAADAVVWKFTPGLTNRFQMSQDTKVTKTGAGGDMSVDSVLTIDMSWTVKEVKPDGSAILEQRVDRMRMSISTADGMKSDIDTD